MASCHLLAIQQDIDICSDLLDILKLRVCIIPVVLLEFYIGVVAGHGYPKLVSLPQ